MQRFVRVVYAMDKVEKSDLERALQERLQHLPPPEWVLQMIDHYRRTGSYRAKDLRRLLGDPTKGVEVGPEASLASCLESRKITLPKRPSCSGSSVLEAGG
jgi:hypothetical protein